MENTRASAGVDPILLLFRLSGKIQALPEKSYRFVG
jgi:hypothetical protein